jgi:hypothetical protein
MIRVTQATGDKEKAIELADNLINLQGSRGTADDLENLNETLEMYEELAHDYAQDNRQAIEENLKTLSRLPYEEAIETGEEMEEDSIFNFDIPGLREEVPIIDVGGIDPIIAILEDEETVKLTEMEEDLTLPPEEEEEEEEKEEEEEEEPVVPEDKVEEKEQAEPGVPEDEAEEKSEDGTSPEEPDTSEEEPSEDEHSTDEEGEESSSDGQFPPGIPAESAQEESDQEEPLPKDITDHFPEEFPVSTDGLLTYLETLTRYLPPPKRRRFLESDMKLKISALRNKLTGNTGLWKEVKEKHWYDNKRPLTNITPDSVEHTFEFIGSLSESHPDKDAGYALKHKIKDLLSSIRSKINVHKRANTDDQTVHQ